MIYASLYVNDESAGTRPTRKKKNSVRSRLAMCKEGEFLPHVQHFLIQFLKFFQTFKPPQNIDNCRGTIVIIPCLPPPQAPQFSFSDKARTKRARSGSDWWRARSARDHSLPPLRAHVPKQERGVWVRGRFHAQSAQLYYVREWKL